MTKDNGVAPHLGGGPHKTNNIRKFAKSIQKMLDHEQSELCGLLISGYTGAGKTFFVEEFLKSYEKQHPVLIARHYQQHHGIPYFGFKHSISDYLIRISNHFNKGDFENFGQQLKDKLGDRFFMLMDYIPELSIIGGKENVYSQKAVPKVENQLYSIFKDFFNFLSEYYQKPVFFFTDDLQWIDISGINLLKYLLTHTASANFIWIGGCRAPHEKIEPLRQMIEAVELKEKYVEYIFLEGLGHEEVQEIITKALGAHCDQGLVDICYELSDGNPSYLQVMLESLKNTGLLFKKDNKWHCDAEAIKIAFAGLNTEKMLKGRLDTLSKPAREMLYLMACMGKYNHLTLTEWLHGDDAMVTKLMAEVQNAGFIELNGSDSRFSEMYIGEMIYQGLDQDQSAQIHYKIAKLLYQRGEAQLSDTDIILMTSHFNQAIDLVKQNGEELICGNLNYRSGMFSKHNNALDQARYFFKMSVRFLRRCPLNLVIEQLYLVYMERAKVEYALGEYDLAEIYLDFLLDHIADPLKRVNAFELKIIINNHLGRYRKVVQILKEGLKEHGLELPVSKYQLQDEVKRLKQLVPVQAQSNSVFDQKVDNDFHSREAILKLLFVGGMGLHHTSDKLMTWAALQIIVISEIDKPSGVKAIGCVSYARMLIISGDIEKGFHYGLNGLEINNALADIHLRCRVYGVYAFYVQPWKMSFSKSMGLLEKGIDAGRTSGDLIGLYILKTHQLNLSFLSGSPLSNILKIDFEESYPGKELTYYITHYQKGLVRFLIGESSFFSIPRQQPSWLAAQLTIQEEKFYRNHVWARYYFLFGHYELAENAAREADANKKLQEGSPLVPANLIIWFLSITQGWEQMDNSLIKSEHEAILERILHSFDLWKQHAPDNYNSPWYLLNAENLRIKGHRPLAIENYEKALETATDNLQYKANAHEMFAKYLLDIEDLNSAAFHLQEAVGHYQKWGAVAKSSQLIQQFRAIIGDAYPESHNPDFETIQHELSGDLEVASLTKKLMALLLRVSGSTRVTIHVAKSSGELSVLGDLSVLCNLQNVDYEDGEGINKIPVSMLLLAHRNQTPVIVNDVATEKGIWDLSTVHKRGVRSFMVLPITITGHFSMVVYLECKFEKNWYIQERIKWIRITANQGAVIIENAQKHEESVKLAEDIRNEMAEKERLASVIEAQKDSHLNELEETQNNERNRIASDLHDSLGSMLSSVKLRFNSLQDDFGKNNPDKVKRYGEAILLLDEAIQELRRIAHSMAPVALKRFGLKASLQTFVEQINRSEQLEVDLQVLGVDERLPDKVEIAVYRICQELCQNVIKHARSASMRIQLIVHNDWINIIVEDKGIGMDKDKAVFGFGFTTIQSKVNLMKGSFNIESQPGKGTMVLVDIPVWER